MGDRGRVRRRGNDSRHRRPPRSSWRPVSSNVSRRPTRRNRSSPSCASRRLRSTWRRQGSSSSPTASPTPATSGRSCGPPRRPGSTGWCSPPDRSIRSIRRSCARQRGALFRVPVLDADLTSVPRVRSADDRHVVASRNRAHRCRSDRPDRARRRQRGTRAARRRAGRRVGDDPPPRPGREPQRGDGRDGVVLRGGPSTRARLMPSASRTAWPR